jgi:hypothetical protein
VGYPKNHSDFIFPEIAGDNPEEVINRVLPGLKMGDFSLSTTFSER